MAEWIHVNATCADCGKPVVFVQHGPGAFSAACADDPHHRLGTEAQRMLDQVIRDNRS